MELMSPKQGPIDRTVPFGRMHGFTPTLGTSANARTRPEQQRQAKQEKCKAREPERPKERGQAQTGNDADPEQGPAVHSMVERYSPALMRLLASCGSRILNLMSQPSPYGDSLTVSGLSSSASLTSTISPAMGM